MSPIDTTTGKEWSREATRALGRHLREEAIAELRARDSANGIPDDGKVYAIADGGGYIVDRNLATLKHKGQESQNAVLHKVATFCSEPQSELEFMRERGLTERQRKLAAMKDRAQTRPQSQATATAKRDDERPAEIPIQARRPGRPRKQAFAGV